MAHKIFQNIIYSLFGTNFCIGSQIKDQIRMVAARLPPEFLHRELDDLGCGDGKITLRLIKIFQPLKLRGFDVNQSLVKRARNNGIQAECMDLDAGLPSGELALMWGVLHHLNDHEACLRRIKSNYPMAFIREPLKVKANNGLEMGQPLVKEEIEDLVHDIFPQASVFYYGHCIFIQYIAPGYL
jgi:SAM-dependent methyltransferase